jgi:hypothetical protein
VLAAAAAASAIVLAGCAAGPRAQTSTPATSGSAAADANAAAASGHSPAARPECGAAQLKTSYTDNSQINNGSLNGMSHHDSVVMFTNEGSAPCWTRGYPGVALLDSTGQQVKQAVRQPGTAPLIVLKPGQEASVELQANSASCSTYPLVAGLLVTAPDQTTSTRLGPPSQPLCLNSVTIGWLVPGNGGGTGY